MRPGHLVFIGVLLTAHLSCGSDVSSESDVGIDKAVESGSLAMPPSAAAPRTSQEEFTPDTVHQLSDEPGDPGQTASASPEVEEIAVAYRRGYLQTYGEHGSRVVGGIDPDLAALARRRAANHQGYFSNRGWAELVASLEPSDREALAARIAQIEEKLIEALHTRPSVPGD